MGATLGCVPRQDCQGTSSLVYVETGPVTNGPNGAAVSDDGDMEVLPRAPRHPSEKWQIPGSGCNNCGPALVNLGHLLEKHTNQPCTAWLHPCCSQYMPNEIATTIEAPDAAPGPIPTQLQQEKTQDAEGFELSEDISEELKLMGMEVWLAAALVHGDDEAKPMTLSPVEVSCDASRASARQPEEEPGASEQESMSEAPEAIMESPMIKEETKQAISDAADQVSTGELAPMHNGHDEEAAVSSAVKADPVAESEALVVNDVDKDEDEAEDEGAYPELFHISALNLSPDVEEEETVEAPLSARFRQIGTVTAPPPPSRGKDIKRRRSAEVMLW